MRLLVSVRSADEVGAALAGGTEIVDVKEPSRGTLGAADIEVVRAVEKGLPAAIPLSVALGDPPDEEAVRAAVGRLPSRCRAGAVILKLGFAGISGRQAVVTRLAAALDQARRVGSPAVVAVAYADHTRAPAPSPTDVLWASARAGAAGVLLDTFVKDGRDLFASVSDEALAKWIAEARARGLLVAVAGSLGLDAIARVADAGPDVIGVRGAACEGGRLGRVSAERVRQLRAAIAAIDGRLRGPVKGCQAGEARMPGSSPARFHGSRV
jgi:(5-formylfuran-3-yl)methyl phosphate synthase